MWEHYGSTYEIDGVTTAYRKVAIFTRAAKNRDTSAIVPLEFGTEHLVDGGGRGQAGAQEEAEGEDEGGAELHDDVFESGDGLVAR